MLLDLLKSLVKYPFATTAKDVRAMKCVVLGKDIAVVAGRDGLFLINRNDIYSGKSLEVYGEYAGLELRAPQVSVPGPAYQDALALHGSIDHRAPSTIGCFVPAR